VLGRLIAAVEDPSRPELIDDIEFASQAKVVPVPVLARASLLGARTARCARTSSCRTPTAAR